MTRNERRRRERIEQAAHQIVQTMPEMPDPEEHPLTQLQRVTQYRNWIERVRGKVSGASELSDLLLERMKDQMGLNDPDPAKAAETARVLLVAGMGDIGITVRAATLMRQQNVDHSILIADLVAEYVASWTATGTETVVTRRLGDETLCADRSYALRINVWLAGEPRYADAAFL